jgi:hypothetical protein
VSENRLLRGILYLSLRRSLYQRNGEGYAFRSFIIHAVCITHVRVIKSRRMRWREHVDSW